MFPFKQFLTTTVENLKLCQQQKNYIDLGVIRSLITLKVLEYQNIFIKTYMVMRAIAHDIKLDSVDGFIFTFCSFKNVFNQ